MKVATVGSKDGEVPEYPQARSDLDINEVDDGLVIYDGSKDNVHYLNYTAAAVFVLSTGTNDVATIASKLQEAFGLEAPPSHDVRACVLNMFTQGLLA